MSVFDILCEYETLTVMGSKMYYRVQPATVGRALGSISSLV